MSGFICMSASSAQNSTSHFMSHERSIVKSDEPLGAVKSATRMTDQPAAAMSPATAGLIPEKALETSVFSLYRSSAFAIITSMMNEGSTSLNVATSAPGMPAARKGQSQSKMAFFSISSP